MGNIETYKMPDKLVEVSVDRMWICKALKSQIYPPLHQGAWESPEESFFTQQIWGVEELNPALWFPLLLQTCARKFKSLKYASVKLLDKHSHDYKCTCLAFWVMLHWYVQDSPHLPVFTLEILCISVDSSVFALEMMDGNEKRKLACYRSDPMYLQSGLDRDETHVCSAPRSGVVP